jgi:hypothetical protein
MKIGESTFTDMLLDGTNIVNIQIRNIYIHLDTRLYEFYFCFMHKMRACGFAGFSRDKKLIWKVGMFSSEDVGVTSRSNLSMEVTARLYSQL